MFHVSCQVLFECNKSTSRPCKYINHWHLTQLNILGPTAPTSDSDSPDPHYPDGADSDQWARLLGLHTRIIEILSKIYRRGAGAGFRQNWKSGPVCVKLLRTRWLTQDQSWGHINMWTSTAQPSGRTEKRSDVSFIVISIRFRNGLYTTAGWF